MIYQVMQHCFGDQLYFKTQKLFLFLPSPVTFCGLVRGHSGSVILKLVNVYQWQTTQKPMEEDDSRVIGSCQSAHVFLLPKLFNGKEMVLRVAVSLML